MLVDMLNLEDEEDIKTMEAKEVYFDLNQKNNNNNSEKASENMN